MAVTQFYPKKRTMFQWYLHVYASLLVKPAFSVAHLDFQRAFWPMRGKWAASRPAAVVFHGERSKGQK